MAKYKLWPDSKLDQLTAEFFKRKGIDPTDVLEYRIVRYASEPTARIELTMLYDEGPAPADAKVTTENPNIVR